MMTRPEGQAVASREKEEIVIAGKWNLGCMLGKGSHGKVYKATDKHGRSVAVKMEPLSRPYLAIDNEVLTYSVLHASRRSNEGIPEIHFSGELLDHKVLVMERLGISLSTFTNFCRGKIPMSDALSFGLQALERIEYVHECGFVHRDIKPANLVFGRKNSKTLYLIDFGLALPYVDFDTGEHIKLEKTERIVGTREFMSVNTQRGMIQSRRDDLESLGYSLIYVAKGMIPWEALRLRRGGRSAFQQTLSRKEACPLEELCRPLPEEMTMYMRYARALEFDAKPDYDFLKGLLRKALTKLPPDTSQMHL